MSNTFLIDGIKWYITTGPNGRRVVQALCPKHLLRLTSRMGASGGNQYACQECDSYYQLKRPIYQEEQYILNKIDSKVFKKMKFINLDNEAIPIAETKINSVDNKYFVTALLTESKVGLRLVVYAGEKGREDKTQIFVEPEIKRLAFDQKDIHPADVFLELNAIFEDGTSSSIKN